MPKIVVYQTAPVWFVKNEYFMAKIDVCRSFLSSDRVIGWDIKMTSHLNSNASFINIWDRLIWRRSPNLTRSSKLAAAPNWRWCIYLFIRFHLFQYGKNSFILATIGFEVRIDKAQNHDGQSACMTNATTTHHQWLATIRQGDIFESLPETIGKTRRCGLANCGKPLWWWVGGFSGHTYRLASRCVHHTGSSLCSTWLNTVRECETTISTWAIIRNNDI